MVRNFKYEIVANKFCLFNCRCQSVNISLPQISHTMGDGYRNDQQKFIIILVSLLLLLSIAYRTQFSIHGVRACSTLGLWKSERDRPPLLSASRSSMSSGLGSRIWPQEVESITIALVFKWHIFRSHSGPECVFWSVREQEAQTH